jgi:hypothetical protein
VNDDPKDRKPVDNTVQEGVTPVQVFDSPAIRVTPGMVLAPRLGRPKRPAPPPEEPPSGEPQSPSTVK